MKLQIVRMSEERVYSPEEAPSNVRLGLLTSICIEEPILAKYNDAFSLPQKVHHGLLPNHL
jgi:hypothetical protein